MQQINKIVRPSDVPDSGIMTDLLWSDPSPQKGWNETGGRGIGYEFGADIVAKFLKDFDLDLI